jgi:hypothetical protein
MAYEINLISRTRPSLDKIWEKVSNTVVNVAQFAT